MWNILYHTRGNPDIPSQAERLENVHNHEGDIATSGIIHTLQQNFPEGIDIGVLLEVDRNNGARISQELGYGPGVWTEHSRTGEKIGVFGRLVDPDAVTFHDLGHKKTAVKAMIGDVAFVGAHLKRPHNRQHLREQYEQADVLASLVADEEKAVVMMDSNSFPRQYPRKLLGRHGLRSVYEQTGVRRPQFPAGTYLHAMPDFEYYASKILGRYFTIDDIMTRGIDVHDAGSHQGLSDHRLLYTRGRLD